MTNDKLRAWFKRPGFLSGPVDELLDRRDSAEFEEPWLRTQAAVQAKRPDVDLLDLTAAVREAAFKVVWDAFGEHDVAACVSDDFGLLGSAVFVDYQDDWLNGLALAYQHGVFPCGRLEPKPEWHNLHRHMRIRLYCDALGNGGVQPLGDRDLHFERVTHASPMSTRTNCLGSLISTHSHASQRSGSLSGPAWVPSSANVRATFAS